MFQHYQLCFRLSLNVVTTTRKDLKLGSQTQEDGVYQLVRLHLFCASDNKMGLILSGLLAYPSIKNSKMLRDLFTYTPNPTEQAITTWAKLLGAQLIDVKAWVSSEQETLEQLHESSFASQVEYDGTPDLPRFSIVDSSSSSSPDSKRRLKPILSSGPPPSQSDAKRRKRRQRLSTELSRSPSPTVRGWSDSPLHTHPDPRRKLSCSPGSSMRLETTKHFPTGCDSPTSFPDTSTPGPSTLTVNPLLVTLIHTDAADHLEDMHTDSLMKPPWIPEIMPMPGTLVEESDLVPPTDSVGPLALAKNLHDSTVLVESCAPSLRTLLNHLLGPTNEKNGFPN